MSTVQCDFVVAKVQISVLGCAKNCIAVGASKSLQPTFTEAWGECFPDKFPSDLLKTETLADNIEDRVATGGRGPTNPHCASDQQRAKPDVVAPGTFILSARPWNAKGEMWKQLDWAESADGDWLYMGGSSQATTLVGGCAASVQESLICACTADPSAALVKALLVNWD